MNNFFKNVYTRCVVIICACMSFTPSILAQNTDNSSYSLIMNPNLYRKMVVFQSISDTLQFTSLKFELTENWSVRNTLKQPILLSHTDIIKQSDILKNMKFHYTSNPTPWQGLGVLFMGITRAALFPTAPDFKP